MSYLRSVSQSHSETETSCTNKIFDSTSRCGNVHPAVEVLKLSIDGLETSKRTIVARDRQFHSRCTYLEIGQYARADAEAVKYGSHPAKSSASMSRVVPVHMLQSSSNCSPHYHNEDPLSLKGVNQLQEGAEHTDTGSSLVPYASDLKAMMALQNRAYHLVHAPSVAHAILEVHCNRLGGFRRPSSGIQQPAARPLSSWVKLTFHECFEPNQISRDCVIYLTDQGKNLTNSEQLTPTDKISVPSASYQSIRRALCMDEPQELQPYVTPNKVEGGRIQAPTAASATVPHSGKSGGAHKMLLYIYYSSPRWSRSFRTAIPSNHPHNYQCFQGPHLSNAAAVAPK